MKSFSKAEASGSSSIKESTIILSKTFMSSMLFRSIEAVTSARMFKLIKMRMNAT